MKRQEKLDALKVADIRGKYASKMYTQAALARAFGVSTNTIRSVVNFETWQGVATRTITEEEIHRSEELMKKLLGGIEATKTADGSIMLDGLVKEEGK